MRYPCIWLVGFLLILARPAGAGVVENLDGWSDGSYGTNSYYTHTGVGQWFGFNSMCHSMNARSTNAVRFDRDAPAPFLEFDGLDGNGKDDGVGALSFYYRHWNGDGSVVKFKVQKNVADGGLDGRQRDRSGDRKVNRIAGRGSGDRLPQRTGAAVGQRGDGIGAATAGEWRKRKPAAEQNPRRLSCLTLTPFI